MQHLKNFENNIYIYGKNRKLRKQYLDVIDGLYIKEKSISRINKVFKDKYINYKLKEMIDKYNEIKI